MRTTQNTSIPPRKAKCGGITPVAYMSYMKPTHCWPCLSVHKSRISHPAFFHPIVQAARNMQTPSGPIHSISRCNTSGSVHIFPRARVERFKSTDKPTRITRHSSICQGVPKLGLQRATNWPFPSHYCTTFNRQLRESRYRTQGGCGDGQSTHLQAKGLAMSLAGLHGFLRT